MFLIVVEFPLWDVGWNAMGPCYIYLLVFKASDVEANPPFLGILRISRSDAKTNGHPPSSRRGENHTLTPSASSTLDIEPCILEMFMCEAFTQIEYRPNIYDEIHKINFLMDQY